MKIFKNRQAAGQLLAKRLKNVHADLILGIPRGGVVVASEIAKALRLPLDCLVTRKIGVPGQEELALGAVDPDGQIVFDELMLAQFKRSSFKFKLEEQWKELKRREDAYRGGKDKLDVEGKTVILVDDGIATGSTVLAASSYLKRHGAKVILAVPVASYESIEKLKEVVTEVVVLETPENFNAVGQFYQNFPQVSDEEVISLLNYGF